MRRPRASPAPRSRTCRAPSPTGSRLFPCFDEPSPPYSPRQARSALSSRRELIQVGQPELFLQLGHLRHRALESFIAELSSLLVFEVFAQLVVRLFAADVVE